MINERGFWEGTDSSGHFYDEHLCEALISLFYKIQAKTILDLGCGKGSYAKSFIKHEFECVALDGNPNTEFLTKGIGKTADLSLPIELNKKFDCVISLEVGEHIPKKWEQTFLDNVCKHAINNIVLSWAVIGQPGQGHCNCQDNPYIIEQMKIRGFSLSKEDTDFMRRSSHISWFKNTLMAFYKS